MPAIMKDANGKVCGAKVAFMLTLSVMLFKIVVSGMVFNGWTAGVADYSGMAVFLAPIGAVYWGRNHDKEKFNAPKN